MVSSPRALLHRRRASQQPLASFPTLTHRLSADNHHALEVSVQNESDWWVYNEVFVDGDYDYAIEAAMSAAHGQPEMSVMDLGANAGYFAARVIQSWRQAGDLPPLSLHMVEGSPSVFSALESRLARQDLEDVSVKPVHALVGDRGGFAEIAEIPFGARNTLHPEHNAGIMAVADMPRHRVRFIDLEELVPSGPIALLKCDVEGSEQLVIEAYAESLLGRVVVAVFEFHHRLVDVDRCMGLLREAGLEPVGRIVHGGDTSLHTFMRVL